MAAITVSAVDTVARAAVTGVGSLPIGTASTNRRVVVFYIAKAAQTDFTSGGVDWTVRYSAQYPIAIDDYWITVVDAVIPTGTTVTFIPTSTGGQMYTLGVFAVTGDVSYPYEINGEVFTEGSDGIEFPVKKLQNGVTISHVGWYNTGSEITSTWTGIPEYEKLDFGVAGVLSYFTGGCDATTVGTTNLTVTPSDILIQDLHRITLSYAGPYYMQAESADYGIEDGDTVLKSSEIYPNAVSKMLNTLIDEGVTDNLDALYLLWAPDEENALTNRVGSNFNLTKINTPTFTPYQGYKGDLATLSYLDTGFNPSSLDGVNFTQNSASMTIYVVEEGESDQSRAGFYDGTGGVTIGVRVTGTPPDLNCQFRINQAAAATSGATFDSSIGQWTVMRHSATEVTMSHNGVNFATSVHDSVPPKDGNLRICGQSDTSIDNHTIGMAAIGNLSEAQDLILYEAFTQFLSDLENFIQPDPGSYTVTGFDTTYSHIRALMVDATSFTVTGQDSLLRKISRLALDATSYVIDGAEAAFARSQSLFGNVGRFVVTVGEAVFTPMKFRNKLPYRTSTDTDQGLPYTEITEYDNFPGTDE